MLSRATKSISGFHSAMEMGIHIMTIFNKDYFRANDELCFYSSLFIIMLKFLKSSTLIVKVWITGFKSEKLLIGKISTMGQRW